MEICRCCWRRTLDYLIADDAGAAVQWSGVISLKLICWTSRTTQNYCPSEPSDTAVRNPDNRSPFYRTYRVERQLVQDVDLMPFTAGEVEESRSIATLIKQFVQFNRRETVSLETATDTSQRWKNPVHTPCCP